MKKFFAVALATAMVASMASVALAVSDADAGYRITSPSYQATQSDGFTGKNDKDGQFYPVVDAYGPYSYDNEEKVLMRKIVEYGDTAYYALIQDTGMSGDGVKYTDSDKANSNYELVKKSEVVSGLKVKAKWEDGSDLVDSVSIVKKKVTNDSTPAALGGRATENDLLIEAYSEVLPNDNTYLGYSDGEYYYFVAVKVKSSNTTADSDIIGTLTLNKSKNPKVDDLELDISLNVDWDNSYRSNSTDYEVTGDTNELKDETYYALKFDADDEVDINFKDGSIFTVDVSGQGKVLLYYDTEFDSKVASKYPLAEFNFWNGNGAKFNRVGEFFLSCDSDYAQFLYQVNSDGTLSEVPGAEYDEYDEGFYFNTRVLGKYVISDMELELGSSSKEDDNTTVATPDPAPSTPVVTNPSTGAVA